LANQFNILDILYPIFADNPASFVYPSHFRHLHDASMMSPYQAETSAEGKIGYIFINEHMNTFFYSQKLILCCETLFQ
jgi:hypothetical protein